MSGAINLGYCQLQAGPELYEMMRAAVSCLLAGRLQIIMSFGEKSAGNEAAYSKFFNIHEDTEVRDLSNESGPGPRVSSGLAFEICTQAGAFAVALSLTGSPFGGRKVGCDLLEFFGAGGD